MSRTSRAVLALQGFPFKDALPAAELIEQATVEDEELALIRPFGLGFYLKRKS
jgi:hypothetical protein